MNSIFNYLSKKVSTISIWLAVFGSIVTIIAFFSSLLENVNIKVLPFLVDNLLVIWGCTITVYIILLSIWFSRLNTRFSKGFKDNFKGDINDNWDFTGDWRKPEKGTLMVSNSDPGGITKKGAMWENYTVTLKTKILHKCIGVVVRAQDLDNYYMIQINDKQITPHRRSTIMQIDDKSNKKDDVDLIKIKNSSGWEVFLDKVVIHNMDLKDWFHVKVSVNGQSIAVYINDQLVLQENSFLQISMGKIGFRNFKTEKALIKDIKVELLN